MRSRLEQTVDVAVPADVLWDYVTDWPRQQEWVPKTVVERVDAADGLGGRFRAWTGVGPVGFWDPMTITAWERTPDGGGRCEVLHLGKLVKGEGEFAVLATAAQTSRFVWAELVVVPGGAAGGFAWRAAGPLAGRFIGHGLRTMRDLVEAEHAAR